MKSSMSVRPGQYRRLGMFAMLLALSFGGLGYRLVDIQVFRHEELLAKTVRMRERLHVQPSRRGQIFDAHGQLLATSVPVKSVYVDPRLVGEEREALARALSPILGIPWEKLAKQMERQEFVDAKGAVQEKQAVPLKHKVALQDWDRVQAVIRDFALIPNTIFPEKVDGELRVYPNGSLAAHVLGFAGARDHPQKSRLDDPLVGKSGIEASLDEELSGTRGVREVIQSERRGELVAMRPLDVAPRSGLGVVLTLDARIQHIVESEIEAAYLQHSPISVTCVVVRPRTGEILALANLPTFDPNRPGAVPVGNWRNRAIADVLEPGSTFKALVVAGALQEQVITLDTEVDCEHGAFTYKRQTLHDIGSHDVLRVEDVIAKSSNIGAAKIGILLGEQRLHHYMRAFGMGEPTRVLLGGEVRGVVHPVKNWSKISVAWIPMGHEVAVTPLQMVMAISAIANDGKLMRPLLVKALVDEAGRTVAESEPKLVRQVIGETAARDITRALKTAVLSGTGRKARLEFYEVAGKTGTAQKLVDGKYSRDKDFISFIGFFPADEPELCIGVFMDQPGKKVYGGEAAAPVWKRIAERVSSYLGIPPTQGVEAPLLTGSAAGRGGF
jgi:cell division protein FtsI/penicillin-binding protein 2